MQHQARMLARANMQQSGSASRLQQSSAGLTEPSPQKNAFEASRPQPSQSAQRMRPDMLSHSHPSHPTGHAGQLAHMARQRLFNREMLLKQQHAMEEMGRAAHFAETVRRHTAPEAASNDPAIALIGEAQQREHHAVDRAAMNERAYRQALISADRW